LFVHGGVKCLLRKFPAIAPLPPPPPHWGGITSPPNQAIQATMDVLTSEAQHLQVRHKFSFDPIGKKPTPNVQFLLKSLCVR